MGKRRWHLSLIAVLLAALIGSTIGCITVVKPEKETPPATVPKKEPAPSSTVTKQPATRLVIEQFTASPDTISAGESVTLSWDVSNAKTVTIQPDVGKVTSKGSKQVKPPYTTVYTLIAANDSGETQNSVTVTVGKAITGKPDLKITSIWLAGTTIYYKQKNQGNAAAKPSRTFLYANGIKGADTYVEETAPGQERTEKFDKYSFTMLSETVVVKVCADGENAAIESDEGNNCGTVIWGPLFTYDFIKNMHMAEWRSGAGVLQFPMEFNSQKGSVSLIGSYMATCPEQVSRGWIQGRFADYYQDEFQVFHSRPFLVPEMVKFTSNVVLERRAPATSVIVTLGYIDTAGGIALFPKMEVSSDGVLHPYEVDLGDIVGRATEFILRVECKGSWEGTCLQWLDPKIVQVPSSF